MLLRRALAAAAALAALNAPARSGEVVDAAASAEKMIVEGRNREAWEALQGAADRVWAAAPLEFRRLLFVVGEAQGFGVYEPRGSSTFKVGEPLRLYGEPFGFGHARDGDQYRIEFEVRLSVARPDGSEAIPARSGRLQLKSRSQNKEFMLQMSYAPKGLDAGDYVLVADVRDMATGKTAGLRLPFRID